MGKLLTSEFTGPREGSRGSHHEKGERGDGGRENKRKEGKKGEKGRKEGKGRKTAQPLAGKFRVAGRVFLVGTEGCERTWRPGLLCCVKYTP